ncbi:MAG: pyridoxamine 5'-phosphate oxidase family protein, partial [Defluviitaleaceae bacterium]|nr:pyridoxamine 5'-phosphate oxidase family protein [Defluviitaleaceae bacterium]
KAAAIIKERTAFGAYGHNKYCTIIQEDLDGQLTGAVITSAKADGLKWISFGTNLDSNKCKRIARDNRAAVCFASEDYSVTLKGRLEILTDAQTKHEHWYKGMEAHFSGPDDENYCVIRLNTEKYSLFIDYAETAGAL